MGVLVCVVVYIPTNNINMLTSFRAEVLKCSLVGKVVARSREIYKYSWSALIPLIGEDVTKPGKNLDSIHELLWWCSLVGEDVVTWFILIWRRAKSTPGIAWGDEKCSNNRHHLCRIMKHCCDVMKTIGSNIYHPANGCELQLLGVEISQSQSGNEVLLWCDEIHR